VNALWGRLTRPRWLAICSGHTPNAFARLSGVAAPRPLRCAQLQLALRVPCRRVPLPALASATRDDQDTTLLVVAAAYGFHEHGDPATRLLFSPR
jgi:hypothetical protein